MNKNLKAVICIGCAAGAFTQTNSFFTAFVVAWLTHVVLEWIEES